MGFILSPIEDGVSVSNESGWTLDITGQVLVAEISGYAIVESPSIGKMFFTPNNVDSIDGLAPVGTIPGLVVQLDALFHRPTGTGNISLLPAIAIADDTNTVTDITLIGKQIVLAIYAKQIIDGFEFDPTTGSIDFTDIGGLQGGGSLSIFYKTGFTSAGGLTALPGIAVAADTNTLLIAGLTGRNIVLAIYGKQIIDGFTLNTDTNIIDFTPIGGLPAGSTLYLFCQ